MFNKFLTIASVCIATLIFCPAAKAQIGGAAIATVKNMKQYVNTATGNVETRIYTGDNAINEFLKAKFDIEGVGGIGGSKITWNISIVSADGPGAFAVYTNGNFTVAQGDTDTVSVESPTVLVQTSDPDYYDMTLTITLESTDADGPFSESKDGHYYWYRNGIANPPENDEIE